MALSPVTAKVAALAEIEAAFGPVQVGLLPGETAALTLARSQLAQSIASMSTYIQINAQVISIVASVTGVTPGPGASGPGSATGTIV